MKELMAKINSETALEATVNDAGKLVLTGVGATAITITDSSTGGAASGAGATAVDVNFSLVFNDTSSDKRGVTVQANPNGTSLTAAETLALGIDVQDANGNLLGAAVDAGYTAGPPEAVSPPLQE